MKRGRLGTARIAVGLAPFALASFLAQAGPPFRTDDPEAVEYKHGEFYVFSQKTLTSDGRSGVLPALEFNYGIYPNVQLHLVTPWAFNKPSGGSTSHGYGDTDQSLFGIPRIPIHALSPVITITADDGFLGRQLEKRHGNHHS